METRWIARHAKGTLDSGKCSRRAYAFTGPTSSTGGAPFVNGMVQCPDCGLWMRNVNRVEGREGTQGCGERCMTSTGPACECKCKGANHGGGWAA